MQAAETNISVTRFEIRDELDDVFAVT